MSAKLSTFIRDNSEAILSEWEAFARTLTQASTMDVSALRDHAKAMLEEVATDIATPQTAREQSDKSKGLRVARPTPNPGAAAEHGTARAVSGFTVVEIVAEFRALRASVVRLWAAQAPAIGRAELDELTRFNEAIDEAVAESLERYARASDETRERFLAILGHDLRNPLGAISTSASFLAETEGLNPEQTKILSMIGTAATRMTKLVADMLELGLSGGGDRMPVRRDEMNIGKLVCDVAGEIRGSYAKANVEVSSHGDLTGSWDSARLAQALTNLVGNAVEHGDGDQPIRIVARGDAAEVTIEVSSSGPTISRERLGQLFDGPMRGNQEQRDHQHLGLGLFIVEKIVAAHGGTVDVRSADSQTAFTIHLPRTAAIR